MKTNLFSTFISFKSVCGVSTQLTHLRPKLSTGTGGNPCTRISSKPLAFVFMTYVVAPAKTFNTSVLYAGTQPSGVRNNKGSLRTNESTSALATAMP